MAAISAFLDGKAYSVLLQRVHFLRCLESCGHYARAESEAAATLDSLCCVLLPEPAGVVGEDPEITALSVELTVWRVPC
jgi:hypothetical protein